MSPYGSQGSLMLVTDSMTDRTGEEAGDFSIEGTRTTLDAACRQAGFDPTNAALIRIGENALYRLTTAPVVVRIARAMDHWNQARKEVAVAKWLSEVEYPGALVVDLPAQPIEINGHPVTFWQFITGDEAMPEDVSTLAQLLRRFHALPVPERFDLPKFEVDQRVVKRLEKSPVSTADKDYLLAKFEEVCQEVADLDFPLSESPIHGDAHIKNVMCSDGNSILIDFENVGYGQPEWDLAVTATEYVTAKWWTDSQYSAFAESYGYDITAWSGFEVLQQVQEIKMTTWLMQNVNQSSEIAAEFATRMRTIRSGKRNTAWQPY